VLKAVASGGGEAQRVEDLRRGSFGDHEELHSRSCCRSGPEPAAGNGVWDKNSIRNKSNQTKTSQMLYELQAASHQPADKPIGGWPPPVCLQTMDLYPIDFILSQMKKF
jgi:hypothetical protein